MYLRLVLDEIYLKRGQRQPHLDQGLQGRQFLFLFLRRNACIKSIIVKILFDSEKESKRKQTQNNSGPEVSQNRMTWADSPFVWMDFGTVVTILEILFLSTKL